MRGSCNNVAMFSTINEEMNRYITWNTKNPIVFELNRPYILDGLLVSLIEYGEATLSINLKKYKTTNNSILVVGSQSILEVLDVDEDRRLNKDLIFAVTEQITIGIVNIRQG